MRESLGTIINQPHNAIINGALELFQRGTSQITIGDGVYRADRFQLSHGGGATIQASRSGQFPTELLGKLDSSLFLSPSVADVTIGATEQTSWRYHIEGYDLQPLIDRDLTLSFYVRTNKPGQYSVSLVSGSGQDVGYLKSYTIDQADTWQRITIKIPKLPVSQGTWNFTNGRGLTIFWALATGSNFLQAEDDSAWVTRGVKLAKTGQENLNDNILNEFRLTGVMLSPGSGIAPFVRAGRNIAEELAMAQRYFVLWGGAGNTGPIGNGAFTTTTVGAIIVSLPVIMRANPTVTSDQPSGFRLNNATNNYQVTTQNSFTATKKTISVAFNSMTVANNGAAIVSLTNAGSASLLADAEL